MIWKSRYWKDDLLLVAKQLDQITRRRRPSEKLLFELEKAVFLSAYIVRKLIEAKKLSDKNEILPISAREYHASGKPVTMMNWHHIDRLYDLEKPYDTCLKLKDLCNQLIHSYVFIPLVNSMTGPVKAILFSSDRKRNKLLFEVNLRDLMEALRIVGEDYPPCSERHFDEKINDYKIKNYIPLD